MAYPQGIPGGDLAFCGLFTRGTLSLQMGFKMNESSKYVERKQINIRLEIELHDFLVEYARQNYKTVTAVVREMIATLYRQNQAKKPSVG